MLHDIRIPQGPHDLGSLDVSAVNFVLLLSGTNVLILIEGPSDLPVSGSGGGIQEKLLLMRTTVLCGSLFSNLKLNKRH